MRPGAAPTASSNRLYGIVIPGMGNAHSHAFHRALRSRTQRDKGSFWTWRDLMYQAANALDPDSYRLLARGVYAEMALAGITSVGEFHYLHHDAGGRRYADPNAMGHALIRAASEAGLRLTLLDTCYLSSASRRGGVERRASTTVRRWQRRRLGRARRGSAPADPHHRRAGRSHRRGVAFRARCPTRSTCPRWSNGPRHTRAHCTFTPRSSARKSSSAWPRTAKPRRRS